MTQRTVLVTLLTCSALAASDHRLARAQPLYESIELVRDYSDDTKEWSKPLCTKNGQAYDGDECRRTADYVAPHLANSFYPRLRIQLVRIHKTALMDGILGVEDDQCHKIKPKYDPNKKLDRLLIDVQKVLTESPPPGEWLAINANFFDFPDVVADNRSGKAPGSCARIVGPYGGRGQVTVDAVMEALRDSVDKGSELEAPIGAVLLRNNQGVLQLVGADVVTKPGSRRIDELVEALKSIEDAKAAVVISGIPLLYDGAVPDEMATPIRRRNKRIANFAIAWGQKPSDYPVTMVAWNEVRPEFELKSVQKGDGPPLEVFVGLLQALGLETAFGLDGSGSAQLWTPTQQGIRNQLPLSDRELTARRVPNIVLFRKETKE